MGSDEIWELATDALRQALEQKGIDYIVNEGDGAFYGPKIDFHLLDSLGRNWQCGTIQLDFVNPENFDLTYTGDDGEKHRPVMIHRVAFGSIERFLGILTEHYAGAFPLWLAPVQARVITVADRHLPFAAEVTAWLEEQGFRVDLDERNERVGHKIRDGELEKIPYLLVVGDKEREARSVSIRQRGRGDLGSVPLAEFAAQLAGEIAGKK